MKPKHYFEYITSMISSSKIKIELRKDLNQLNSIDRKISLQLMENVNEDHIRLLHEIYNKKKDIVIDNPKSNRTRNQSGFKSGYGYVGGTIEPN